MSTNYILTVPHGTKVEVKYEERRKGPPAKWEGIDPIVPHRRKDDAERRNIIPRRLVTKYPLVEGAVYGNQMVGKRKACFDRRVVNGIRRSVAPDYPIERRDPSREMYQYRTSHDPRIRALERRNLRKGTYLDAYLNCTRDERRVGPANRRSGQVGNHWARRLGLADRRKP